MSDSSNGDPITIWPPTSIRQSARERLIESIRMGGMDWHQKNNPRWRDKPWKDGISVDLDETDVLEMIADRIIANADPDSTEQQGESL